MALPISPHLKVKTSKSGPMLHLHMSQDSDWFVSFEVRAVDGMSVLDPVEYWDATDPALVFTFGGDSSFLETLLWLGEGEAIRSMMVFSRVPALSRDLPGGDFHETSDLVLPACESDCRLFPRLLCPWSSSEQGHSSRLREQS